MKKKHAGGRPTKYKPEYCQAMIRFFNIEPHSPKDMTITKSDGTRKDLTVDEAADLPFFMNFCKSIDIRIDTMHQWIFKYPEFSDAYKESKELQKNVLITNGLRGLYAPSFAIFTAKNILGWRDKQEIEHTGDMSVSFKGGNRLLARTETANISSE